MSAKPPPSLAPKFLRGTVWVSAGDSLGEYPRALISSDGVYGLRWPPFVPAKHFGKIVEIKMELSATSHLHRFEMQASVIHEYTMRSERMGLKFVHRDFAAHHRLVTLIQTQGHYPIEHERKHPRIPSTQFTHGFELRASGLALPSALNSTPQRIQYRILNLSPEGLLLQTNNANATAIRAGDLIDVLIRGTSAGQTAALGIETDIHAKLKVFRCLHEIEFASQKEQWLFGLQFHRPDEATRRQYFKLLEGILNRIKSAA